MRTLDDQISLKDQFLDSTSQFSPEVFHLLKIAKSKSDSLQKTGISISYYEANLINFFIKQFKCKKFVEIGTLTGFSAVSILSVLQSEGCLWTLEKNEVHASLARELFSLIDYSLPDFKTKRINLVVGDAVESMASVSSYGPFDGVFIDGNKSAYVKYLSWALENISRGGLIIADNVFLSGTVFSDYHQKDLKESKFSEKQINVMKDFNCQILDKKKFHTVFLPTSEGLSVSIKL